MVADLPGGSIPYTLRYSARARGLRVTIHPDRGVVVTVPATRDGRLHGERHATAFVAERQQWIRRHVARQAAEAARIAAHGGARDGGEILYHGGWFRISVVPAVSGMRRSHVVVFPDEGALVVHRVTTDRRTEAAILEAWLREEARVAIDAAIDRHAGPLGVSPTTVTLRDPRSRWGSAARTGRLSFSWRLVMAPPEALETVVVHELAHLRVFGHGAPFWALVATRQPDHRAWRRWLHDHAIVLHGALEPRTAVEPR